LSVTLLQGGDMRILLVLLILLSQFAFNEANAATCSNSECIDPIGDQIFSDAFGVTQWNHSIPEEFISSSGSLFVSASTPAKSGADIEISVSIPGGPILPGWTLNLPSSTYGFSANEQAFDLNQTFVDWINEEHTLLILANSGGVPYTIASQTRLTVNGTMVPIPGAAWLLGSGLFGIAGLRRKFQK
jgi:hypothetical protein